MLIQKELKKEKNRLDKLLRGTIKELSDLKKIVPEGAKLRVGRSGNTTQYYLRKSISDKTGTYIRKKDSDIANIRYGDAEWKHMAIFVILHLKSNEQLIYFLENFSHLRLLQAVKYE